MKACVFCSANQQLDPDFFTLTKELGQWLAKEGHTLVYGGVNCGLMECVAKAVHEAGGRTIGVIPQIVEKSGRISDHVEVELLCDNLSDRKQLMQDQGDVFIALPGGIGTLMKGYWDSLVAMLDGLQAHGGIRQQWRDYIEVANSLEDIKALL